MPVKKFAAAAFFSWLLFVSLDFLAHAAFFRSLWARDLPALKTKAQLFRLIPAGYLSFFLLTVLFGWIYLLIYRDGGTVKKGVLAGILGGSLFSLSLFLGWYSFLSLPTPFLATMSVVYFVELTAVGFSFGFLLSVPRIRKRALVLTAAAILVFIMGIVIQNIPPAP